MRVLRKLLHLFRRIIGIQGVIDVLRQESASQTSKITAQAADLTVHGSHQIEDLRAYLDAKTAALQSRLTRQIADLAPQIAKIVSVGPEHLELPGSREVKAFVEEPAGAMVSPDSEHIGYDAHLVRAGLSGGAPALVVPLDHDEVVPVTKNREPYHVIGRMFEKSLNTMTEFCRTLEPFLDIRDVSDEQVDAKSPFWNNGYFAGDDAKVAYAVVRRYKPAQILECGSGNSTKFFRKAIADGGLSTRLTSIDPCPRAEISGVADLVIPSKIQDAPLELFDSLAAGDVLFLDGSHLVFHGTDVPHFFVRLLPRVRPGVFVHVHDISLPDEYPEVFDKRYYNEQYVLAAFLLCNKEWEVLAPVRWLHGKGVLPIGGNSFWMKRAA